MPMEPHEVLEIEPLSDVLSLQPQNSSSFFFFFFKMCMFYLIIMIYKLVYNSFIHTVCISINPISSAGFPPFSSP